MQMHGPVGRAGEALQAFALRGKSRAVGSANRFDATDRMLAFGFEAFELHVPLERQVFLGRIEHLHDVAAHPGARVMTNHRFDPVERIEPVRHQHHGAVRGQRHHRRQAGRRAALVERLFQPGLGDAAHRDASGDRSHAGAQHGDALAGIGQQARERQRDHLAADCLGVEPAKRGVVHRGRGIAPQPDAGRGFPFGLAHEQMPAARALAPVDPAGAVAVAVGPVLPEGVALADPTPAVHALDHGRRDAVGRHHQRRQGTGEFKRSVEGGRTGHD